LAQTTRSRSQAYVLDGLKISRNQRGEQSIEAHPFGTHRLPTGPEDPLGLLSAESRGPDPQPIGPSRFERAPAARPVDFP
jgi:hypothetical protein